MTDNNERLYTSQDSKWFKGGEKEREFLATQVMGWQADVGKQTWFWTEEGKLLERFMFQKDFDPRNNIEQSINLYNTVVKNKGWRHHASMEDLYLYCVAHGTEAYKPTDAIVNAILQAYNWKGEE